MARSAKYVIALRERWSRKRLVRPFARPSFGIFVQSPVAPSNLQQYP